MNYSNILIVTENFTLGGLETHLAGGLRQLSKNHYNLYLAVTTECLEENLPPSSCKKIFTDFNLPLRPTAADVAQTVSRLVEIIQGEHIDVVHAHPFNSAIPAFFAAQICQKPFVYTLHGPASTMESEGQLAEWFIKYVLLNSTSLVSNVSQETYLLTKYDVPDERNFVFPNSVDTTLFTPGEQEFTNLDTCCFASRVDSMKISSIKAFITLARSTSIKQVDIYGNGPELDMLQEWIAHENADEKILVRLMGASNQLHQVYKGYPLIAGMGRVVLEAAAMDKPVILAGYDGVKGLLSDSWVTEAAYANFSGRGLSNIDGEALKKQLSDLKTNARHYQLSTWVEQNSSEEKVWLDFMQALQQVRYFPSSLALDIYQCFVGHQSSLAFTSDYDLLQKVKKILRSNQYIDSNAYKFMQDYDQRVLNYTADVHTKQVDQQLIGLYEKMNRVKEQGVQTEKAINTTIAHTRASLDQSVGSLYTEIQELAQTFQNKTAETTEKLQLLHETIERGTKDTLHLVSTSLNQSADSIHTELQSVKQILEKEITSTKEQLNYLNESVQKAQSDNAGLINLLQSDNSRVSAHILELLKVAMEARLMLQDIVSTQNNKIDQLENTLNALSGQLQKATEEIKTKDAQLKKLELELGAKHDKMEELNALLKEYRKAYEEVGILKMITNRFRPKPFTKG